MYPLFAEAPLEDFARDHAPILAIVICVILAILAARLIQRTMTRMVLFGLLGLVSAFVVVERQEIRECSRTCSCELAGVDTEVPYCNYDLP